MRQEPVKLLDVVALLVDKPADGLTAGHVGTVVEVFTPDAMEVEFLDPAGKTFAVTELKRSEILLLKHEPVPA
jgi:catabolite regulation protein CreA